MSAAALALYASGAAAQTTNFSGRWIAVPDPPAQGRGATGSMGSGWGADITVTQDATALTIEYTPFVRYDMQPVTKLVYLLNGSESRNTINMGRGPQEQISKTTWDGSKLVITTTHTFAAPRGGDAPRNAHTLTSQITQVLSLESPASLVIETTRSGALGGQPSTTKTMYKKS